MRNFRPQVSIANAIRSTGPASGSAARPEAPVGPPPFGGAAESPSGLRRRFARVAAVADYVRRFLTIGLEARLQQIEASEAAHRRAIEAVETVLTLQSSRSSEAERVVHDQLREILRAIGPSQDAQDRWMAGITQTVERLERKQAAMAQDLEALRSSADAALAGVNELRSLVGPRFDEIEVKLRPMFPFDTERWAIRVRDGYVLVPQAEPALALMVANATSAGLEAGTRRVMKALIAPGMGVVDVGANIGLLTLAAASAAGPSGRVFAFEPEERPRTCLADTLRMNGLSWVELRSEAVGRQPGRLAFHISPIIGHSSLYELPQAEQAGQREVQVDVIDLDRAIPEGVAIDVVKIDVEGAELDVLAGMSRILSQNRDIAIIAEFGPSHLARVGTTPQAWFAAFAAAGFNPLAIDESTGVCRPTSPAELQELESINLAFVRPGGAAAAKLAS